MPATPQVPGHSDASPHALSVTGAVQSIAMPRSQNLRFVPHAAPADEFDHPGGDGLMRQLCRDLALVGWTVGEINDWRDCGFSAVCQRGSEKLNLVMTKVTDGDWMIQIHAGSDPGWLGRWLGKVPSATPTGILELSAAVHRALADRDFLRRPRWRWDGFPEDDNSTGEPKPHA